MAFSVKQVKAKLQEYGVPAEQLDTAAEYFCAAHKTDLDAIKEERDALKTDVETLTAAKKELDALKNQPDDGYKAKYEKEHKAFEDFKAETAKKEALAAKTAAFREILKDAGITSESGVAKVLKYTDLDGWELGDDGKFKDAKEILKSVKTEWPEQITKEGVHGANTPNPPANNGGGLKTLDEIYKTDEHGRFVYDATQRQQARAEIIAAQQQKG